MSFFVYTVADNLEKAPRGCFLQWLPYTKTYIRTYIGITLHHAEDAHDWQAESHPDHDVHDRDDEADLPPLALAHEAGAEEEDKGRRKERKILRWAFDSKKQYQRAT